MKKKKLKNVSSDANGLYTTVGTKEQNSRLRVLTVVHHG